MTSLEDRAVPANITGLAFEDFNADGQFDTTATEANSGGGTVAEAVDVGVGGVAVTAFDATNTAVATTTTSTAAATLGTYTLTGLATGTTYRIEFSTLPAGFTPGPHGPTSGTTVQFAAGGVANVNLGLVQAPDYSPNDPTLVSERYEFGADTGGNAANATVQSIPYTGGGTTANSAAPAATTLATQAQVGAVFGLAASQQTGTVYAAAYTKLHTGYGPGGNGAIYSVSPTGAVTTLVDFNALFGAGVTGDNFRAGYAAGDAAYTSDSVTTANSFTDPYTGATYTSWDAVGKTAFGGMAVSDDGTTLYVMNLANRTLYAIPLDVGTVTAAEIKSVAIPTVAAVNAAVPAGQKATGTATPDGDLQPFAVTYHNGQVYVGIVNSAESTQQQSDLHAYVYTVDPATLTFGAAPAFVDADFTYNRAEAQRYNNSGPGLWHPWSPTYQNVSTTGGLVYAQPMLTGIAFDAAGNMTLGYRDRVGDQGGDKLPVNPASPATDYETFPVGETVRAFGNPTAGWTLESDGKGPGGTPVGTDAGSGSGPGTAVTGYGEFYRQQFYQPTPGMGGHGDTDAGGVAEVPGFPDVAISAYDPFENAAVRTGGIRFNSTGNGAIDKAYQTYTTDQAGTFGKSNGIGDLVFVTGVAPIEIGNRVFADANADGLQEAGEAGIAGVTVHLYANGGTTPIATAVTDANGNYYFSNAAGTNTASAIYGLPLAPGTTYSVRVDNATDYTTGHPLAGQVATTAFAGTDPGIDSNGVPTGTATNVVAAVTTGAAGASDHTLDFGFTPGLSLGDFVWDDANNNGQFDAGEAGLNGVTVSLLDGAGNPVLDAAGNPITTTTANNPTSGVAGYYQFTGLLPGTYTVRLSNLPAGYVSSTGNPGSATGAYEPGSTNFLDTGNDTDHGTEDTTGGTVTSQPVTLTAAGTNPDADAAGDAGDANENVDLGVFQPLSLGDLVFVDSNNDGTLDGAEAGIDGVVVDLLDGAGNPLLDGAGNPITATTAGGGAYLFTNLGTGTYQVRLDASNFTGAGVLVGYRSSTGTPGSPTGPTEPGSTDYSDTGNNTDHGTNDTTDLGITGQPVTLGTVASGANPDDGGTADLNADFGVFEPLSIGNFVFNDATNSGVYGGADTAIAGVSVSLLDSNNGNAVVATTTTNASGYYLFTDLVPGKYVVRIDAANFAAGGPLAGYTSSTGTPGSLTGTYEPATQGSGGNNTDHGTVSGPLGTTGVVIGNPITLAVGGEPTGEEEPAATTGITDPALDANSDATQDFGFFQSLSLGDTVFVDANNDGVLDNGEVGLGGVTVQLLNSGGTVVQTTTTSSAAGTLGQYLFTGLTPGTYSVRFTPPAGYVSSTGANGKPTGAFEPGVATFTDATNNQDHGTQTGATITSQPITLGAAGSANDPDDGGTANLNVDLGVFQPLSLGNFVFADTNDDGVVDNGEAGIPNVGVSLLDQNNNVVTTTTTNAQGYYLFTDLAPGSYRVRIDATNFTGAGALVGYASSTGTPGSPTGPYEPATAGLGNDNTDHGTTQTTGPSAGSVVGTLVALSVGGETTGQPATPGITDPAANGNRDVTQDFGFFQPLSLGDTVFVDANNDGVLDNGEAGLDGVTVTLYNSTAGGVPTGPAVATTTTAGGGKYLFTDLVPGTYVVRLSGAPLAGYVSSTGSPGSATGTYEPGVATFTDATNNEDHGTEDAGGTTITSRPVTLGTVASGTNPDTGKSSNLNVDLGVFQPLSLGDYVFSDPNDVGTYTGAAGQAPIGGATVALLNGTGNPVLNAAGNPITTTTAANGSYLFTDLVPGQYKVRVTPPSGDLADTAAAATFLNATNNQNHGVEDGSGTTATSGTVTLGTVASGANPDAAGTANTNADFGFYQPLSLGNEVFVDNNNDGKLDGADAGLNGVTVTLLNAATGAQATDASGALVPAATTATVGGVAGSYLFTNLLPGTYKVQLSGTGLAGYSSSTGAVESSTSAAPYPYEPGLTTFTDATNNQDHGTQTGATITSQPVTLGTVASGTNPDGTGAANLNVDLGVFQPLSLGDFVFSDPAGTGTYNPATDTPIGGATVALLDGNGNPVLNGTTPVTTTTAANGSYLFTDLTPGNYKVRVTPPAGDRADATASTDFSNTGNNLNHGVEDGSGTTATSGTVTLGSVASGSNPDAAGTANTNADFGFHQTLSLGDKVFVDSNDDGVLDNGEAGLDGVTVTLFASTAGGVPTGPALATTTTTGGGNYSFAGLVPGTYVVQLSNLPAGYVSSTGAVETNTSAAPYPYEPGSTDYSNAGNNFDHGTQTGATVTSQPVTLGTVASGTNPDAAGTANTNVDFGVFQPLSLGNQVFADANDDGKLDGTDAGVSGVSVSLLNSTGGVVATTTTTAGGYYLFTDLLPGAYTVRINAGNFAAGQPLAGYTSSTGTVGSPTGPYEPATQGLGGDTTDHGTTQTTGANAGAVLGQLVTLSIGGETAGQPATPGVTDLAGNGDRDVTQDFGFFVPATVAGTVYFDADTNRTLDAPPDSPLAGAIVTLSGTVGGAAITPVSATTGANGTYSFGDLPAGTYTLTVTPPAGYAAEVANPGTVGGTPDGTATGATATTAVALLPGNAGVNYNFGEVGAGVSGTVFLDANRDGTLDNGETGLPNPPGPVTVTLTDSAGVVHTTQTGANGTYSFADIPPGAFTLVETPPTSLQTTSPITLTGTETTAGVTGENFGLVAASLAGTVYFDANADKALDAGDVPLGNVTVTLTRGTGQPVADIFGNTVNPVTTAVGGTYSFPNLPAGTYTVTVTTPAGYTAEVANVGTVGGTPDGTAAGVTAVTTVGLPAGGQGVNYNFGETGAAVDGTVFIDTNGSGSPAGQTPLAGATVTVKNSVGVVVGTQTTGANGTYSFTNLPPGSYTVTETSPAGYGADGKTPDPATVAATAATPGVANFGATVGSLGGFVYFDSNKNLTRDVPPDAAVPNATVTLTTAGGQPVTDAFGNTVGPATTGTDGSYLFADLLGGNYVVTVTQPAGYNPEVANPGTVGGTTDGTANGLTRITGVNLPAAGAGVQYNFGEQGTTLSGEVYVDNNPGNGLGGVTITLTDGTGQTVGTTTTAADGTYSFGNLPAGTYTVTETIPSAGGTPLYSAGTPVTISATVPTTGLANQDFDLNTASLAGNVYHDVNDNGQLDAGTDAPLDNVTVTLTGTDATGAAVDDTTITTDGAFAFTGLLPSNAAGYTLTETQPTGYLQRTDTVGSLGDAAISQTATQDVETGIPVAAGNAGVNYNFGEVLPTSVAGTVYFDANNDGVFDATPAPADTPLAGVTVTLSGTDDLGHPIPAGTTTTTAANGTYSFTGLRPGTYMVTETQPAGYDQGTNNLGTVTGAAAGQAAHNGQTGPGTDVFSGIGLPSGTAGVAYNFGEVGAGVSGTVFLDGNKDGVLDDGESGLTTPPVTVTLTDSAGVVHTTQTNPDGTYTFTDIPPGAFTLTETPPAGFATTSPTTLSGTETAAGVTDENFGVATTGLSGTVYFDANTNRVFDAGDTGVPGVTVTLTNGEGGAVTDAAGNPVGPQQSGPGGTYLFSNLLAGTYTVTVTQPAAYTGEVANPGPDGGTPAGVTSITQVTIPAGGLATGNNFGEVGAGVSGTVFLDGNRDGTLDGAETGLPYPAGPVTVTLTDSDGHTHTTQTGPDGTYSFADIPPGAFTLTETPPASLHPTSPTILSGTETIAGVTGENFGLAPASLSGTVYFDANTNRVFDAGDAPLGGVTVTLTNSNGTPVTDVFGHTVAPVTTSTTPGSVGTYSFGNLPPGSYTVTVTQPAGYDAEVANPGTVGGATDGAAAGVTAVTTVGLPAGGQGVNYNFGESTTFLSGEVFVDGNPAAGLPGVQVTLTGNGQTFTTTTGTGGGYFFGNLPAGPYTVTETIPSAGGTPLYSAGSPVVLNPTVPTTGLPNQDFDLNTASLAGNVYLDNNDNGRLDPGTDAPLDGVVVTLSGTDAAGNPVDRTTQTAADGTFQFSGLLPSNGAGYTLTETQPAGTLQRVDTPGTLGSAPAVQTPTRDVVAGIPVAAGDRGAGYNFGEVLPAAVGGSVYFDANSDGVLDAGDRGLPGVAVTLTGTDDNGTPVGPVTVQTDASGNYSFIGLRPGTYTVTETQPAGYNQGTDTLGTAGGTLPAQDVEASIPLGSGTGAGGYDFGEVGTPVSGTVFTDGNGTGTAGGQPPAGGGTVTLTDPAGTVVATTTTGPGGTYLFPNVPPGTYTVTATPPAGFGPDPLTPPATITVGTTPVVQNFGVLPTATDVAVVITTDSPQVNEGAADGFTVTVTNNGPVTATDTTVSILLPPGLSFASNGGASQGAYDPGTGLWDIGTLPVGASVTLRFTADVTGPGPYTPVAVVSIDQRETNLGNNVSSTSVTAVDSAADITKRDFLASTPGVSPAVALDPTALPAAVPDSLAVIATGAGPGAEPLVEVWDRQTGQLRLAFLAYDPSFTGGVNVALADVNGDGYPDVITAPQSGGGPNVKVFDGRTGQLISSFYAFEPSFTGGVNLAAGDVEGTGRPDILAGAGVGGAPRVAVYRTDGTMVSSVYAYDSSFRDGVTVAAGDVFGTGRAQVIAGSGAGGGPNVRVFDGVTGAEDLSFFAFDPSFRGGVSVAAGDTDGSGRDSIIAAPGAGGGPVVGVYDGRTGRQEAQYMALDPTFRGGVNVASADLTGDGRDDLVVSPKAGGGPVVVGLDALTGAVVDGFDAFDPTFHGGVNVAAADKK